MAETEHRVKKQGQGEKQSKREGKEEYGQPGVENGCWSSVLCEFPLPGPPCPGTIFQGASQYFLSGELGQGVEPVVCSGSWHGHSSLATSFVFPALYYFDLYPHIFPIHLVGQGLLLPQLLRGWREVLQGFLRLSMRKMEVQTSTTPWHVDSSPKGLHVPLKMNFIARVFLYLLGHSVPTSHSHEWHWRTSV